MKRFATVHRGDDASRMACTYIKNELTKKGFLHDFETPELIICVGGDGHIKSIS